MTHWSDRDPNTVAWRKALPPLFDGVNDVDVNTALRRFTERELVPGELFCREGEPANSMVCVREGELEVRTGEQVLATLGVDALAGEMGLFEDSMRIATMVATRPTRVLVLTRDGYEELRGIVHPAVGNFERAALRVQVERMRKTGDRLAQLVRGTPVEPVSLGERFRSAITHLFGPGGMFPTEQVDTLGALRRSELFADVPEDFLADIAQTFRAAAYHEGQLLCTQGEAGRWMYVVDTGQVDIVVNAAGQALQRVNTLGPGTAVGMVAMATPGRRMASVVARSPVVVHALGREGWDELINHPWGTGSAFRRAVIRAFGKQLSATNQQVARYETEQNLDALRSATAHLA